MSTPFTPRRRRAALAAGALGIVSVLALAGCGRATEATDTEASSVSDGLATGTITMWAGSGEGDALQPLIDEFEEANPDVTVELTVIPQDDVPTKVTTGIASGSVPDLTFLYTETQYGLLSTGGFAPVPEDYIDMSAFYDTAVDAGVVDGTSYTVPWYVQSYELLYRKDLAEAAGVDAPETWDDYLTFMDALQAEGAEYGTSLEVGYGDYTASSLNYIAASMGASLISDDLSTWQLDDPTVVEAADYWGHLILDGYANADGPSFGDQAAWFVDERSASYVIGPWAISMLTEATDEQWVDDNVGYTLIPGGSEGSAGPLSGGNLAVFKDAENADAAWKFVKFLTEPETQIEFYELQGVLPSDQSAWDDEVFQTPYLQTMSEQLDNVVLTPQVSTWSEVAAVVGSAMERIARGDATADEAMADAQAEAESIGVGD